MNRVASMARTAALLLAVLFLSACGSSPRTAYYVLRPATEVAPAGERPALGIAALEVADYLLAAQLATGDGTRVVRADFHRWAEPLDEGIARVLLLDLGGALDTQAVRAAPWPRDWVPEWELRVRIERLDAGETEATLVAAWSLQDGARSRPARDRLTRLSRPRSGGGTATIAADFSALLGEFAGVVAGEVRTATAEHPASN
jgi:uncharacterized lipoprotein YmbA